MIVDLCCVSAAHRLILDPPGPGLRFSRPALPYLPSGGTLAFDVPSSAEPRRIWFCTLMDDPIHLTDRAELLHRGLPQTERELPLAPTWGITRSGQNGGESCGDGRWGAVRVGLCVYMQGGESTYTSSVTPQNWRYHGLAPQGPCTCKYNVPAFDRVPLFGSVARACFFRTPPLSCTFYIYMSATSVTSRSSES